MLTNNPNKFKDVNMNRQPFYLSKRTLNSGKHMYYFYTYDKFGNRTCPKSTGCSKKADAFSYCASLLKKNMIDSSKVRFRDYAAGFFDEGSNWYRNRTMSGPLASNTLKGYRSYLKFHIYPYFENMLIERITPNDVRAFRVYLKEEKDLANKTINNIVDCARIIFDWAIEDDVVLRNPVTRTIKPLEPDHDREAFTLNEVKYLFREEWDNKTFCLFTLTIAMTGLRFSEAMGLTADNVHSEYIDVYQQWQDGELTPTKERDKRFIPIPKKLSEALIKLSDGNKFVFFDELCNDRPLSRTRVVKAFYERYSIQMRSEKNDRLLTYHALRYFFNTYLISSGISSTKVNFCMGHSEGKGSMLALYTTWKPEMYTDVLKLQESLLDQIIQADVLSYVLG